MAAGEGKALGTLWREQTSALVALAVNALGTEVDLVSISADGAMVPMCTEEEAGLRPWREARLVTFTLYAKPDPAHPREVTMHDERGEAARARVGLERPRLGTLVFANMPTPNGPKGPGARRVLRGILAAVGASCAGARLTGVWDGGEWPERTLERAIGHRRRTTDVYHASEHLRAASRTLLGDGPASLAWYRRRRTHLLRSNGAAEAVAAELEAAAERTTRSIARRKALRAEAGFFRKHRRHMRYASALARDEPIGSGVVEAAVEQVITLRRKRTRGVVDGRKRRRRAGPALLAVERTVGTRMADAS